MNPSLIQLHHANAHHAERTAPRRRRFRKPSHYREPTMTLLATSARRRPASHAFAVPVVRELAPTVLAAAGGSAW